MVIDDVPELQFPINCVVHNILLSQTNDAEATPKRLLHFPDIHFLSLLDATREPGHILKMLITVDFNEELHRGALNVKSPLPKPSRAAFTRKHVSEGFRIFSNHVFCPPKVVDLLELEVKAGSRPVTLCIPF